MTDTNTSNSPTTEDAAAELAQLRADYAHALERIAVLQETLKLRTDALHLSEAARADMRDALKYIVGEAVWEGLPEHVANSARAAIARAEGGAQ